YQELPLHPIQFEMISFINTHQSNCLIDWVTIRPKRNLSTDPLEHFIPRNLPQGWLEIAARKGTLCCKSDAAPMQQRQHGVIGENDVTVSTIIPIEIGRHTSELQSPDHLVCRLLLEKKKNNYQATHT